VSDIAESIKGDSLRALHKIVRAVTVIAPQVLPPAS
jgi:hypothetical protein